MRPALAFWRFQDLGQSSAYTENRILAARIPDGPLDPSNRRYTEHRAFSYAHDFPPGGPQMPGNPPVALLIRFDLLAPEFSIGARQVFTTRASVPEAAIDKDGDLEPRPCKVGTSVHGPVFPITAKARAPQHTPERHLRCSVPFRTNRRHDLRPNLFRDVVHDLPLRIYSTGLRLAGDRRRRYRRPVLTGSASLPPP